MSFFDSDKEGIVTLTAEQVLNYTVADGDTGNVHVVIVCGGSSQRMHGTDKMFAVVGNMEVAARSISVFDGMAEISGITVVAKEENILKMQQLCEKHGFKKVTDIVAGGKNREESVKNGLDTVKQGGIVLIHDGARPLVTVGCIKRVIEGAVKYSNCTCAVALKDTVKLLGEDGFSVNTLDRKMLRAIQTPQGFDGEMIKKAFSSVGELSAFTDDCSVAESFGFPTYIVEGDEENIKITTQNDLAVADNIIRRREND